MRREKKRREEKRREEKRKEKRREEKREKEEKRRLLILVLGSTTSCTTLPAANSMLLQQTDKPTSPSPHTHVNLFTTQFRHACEYASTRQARPCAPFVARHQKH